MSRRAWAAFAAMSVLWGGSYLLIEIAERGGMPAIWVAWLRIDIGAIVLLSLAWRAGVLGPLRARVHPGWLVAYAVGELALPWPLISIGESHVPSSVTAIIIASVPLFTTLLALRFDRAERPSRAGAVGLGIGFAGVVVLVGFDLTGSTAELLGAGAILLASFGYGACALVYKHALAAHDPRATMGVCLAIAAVLVAPAAAVDAPARTPTVGAMAAVLALGLVCTAAALVIFAVLLREVGPARGTVFTYLNPVVALALGVTLEGELSNGLGQAIAGLVLVLIGSLLATTGGVSRAALQRTARGRSGPRGGAFGGPNSPL